MRKFYYLTIALLASAAPASAQTGSSSEMEIENLTVAQLCEMQGDSEAVAELERRELFSRRELRAIRKNKARRNISLKAFECAIGMSERDVLYRSVPGAEQIEVYRYSSPDMPDLTVSVGVYGDQAIVMEVLPQGSLLDILALGSVRTHPRVAYPQSSYTPSALWISGPDGVDLQQPEWDSSLYLDPFPPGGRPLLRQNMGVP